MTSVIFWDTYTKSIHDRLLLYSLTSGTALKFKNITSEGRYLRKAKRSFNTAHSYINLPMLHRAYISSN